MAKKKHPEHVNHERWLVSYADFITLLFAFFVVMFAVSQVDTKKMGSFSESFSRAVGESFLMEGGRNLLAEGGPPPPEEKGKGDGRLPKELEKLAKALSDKGEDLSGLKVLRRRNELVIRLADSVLFDSGDDTVKGPAIRVLMTIANELRDRKVDVRVEGHTDDVPIRTVRFRSNWDLSAARATAVITQLAGPGRIAPARLAASGYGEFHPVASNATPEGRAQNRRVDLVVAAAVEETSDKAYAAPSESGEPGAGEAAPSAKVAEEEAPGSVEFGPPLPPEMLGEPESPKPEPAGDGHEDPHAAGHEDPNATGHEQAPSEGHEEPAKKPGAEHEEPAKDPSGAHDEPAKKPGAEHEEPAKKPAGTHDEPAKKPAGAHGEPAKKPAGAHDEPTKKPAGTHDEPAKKPAGTHDEHGDKAPAKEPAKAPATRARPAGKASAKPAPTSSAPPDDPINFPLRH